MKSKHKPKTGKAKSPKGGSAKPKIQQAKTKPQKSAAAPVETPPTQKVTQNLPIKVSHPEKIYWPDEGYTKLQLIEFYAGVFPKLKPYVDDRILSLERCPEGMRGSCFYQKEAPTSLPPGTPTKAIAVSSKSRKVTNYVVGGALATQLALANLGCIALHVSGSCASSVGHPDWICFDLDPQSGKFADAANAGLRLKEMLDALKLKAFPKTSGSRGLHVFIPIKRGPTAREVLDFAESLVSRLAAQHPDELTVEHSIAARGQRVYLDAYRNGSAQTVVSPYSVRRRAKAPYSAPLDWSEVKPGLDPANFNIGNYQERLKAPDPWADFFKSRQPLNTAIKALAKL
jgi:bifunctional non-homologous end joining protein LigD